jgi:hypothetical protein
MEEFGMTPSLRKDKGEGSSGDSIVISEKQQFGESPLLPSPHTLKKMCHPETHPPRTYA